jgi:hypothetical protein
MPRFSRPAYRRFSAAGVLLLLPIVLAACPSTGAATGNTMHFNLVDDFTGNIGGGILGSSGTALEGLEGDLAEGGPGTWRGVLHGTTDRTIEVTVMTENCQEHIVGTQEIDMVAVQGSFGDMNFHLTFTPKSAASYSSPETCPGGSHTKASNGIEWLAFNNESYRDGNMYVKLPDKPGGSWQEGQGQGQSPDDPCTALAPLLGCEWTRTLTVEYHSAGGS